MKIANETLKKLTNREALDLDLMTIGCMFVRGEAKKRVKGFKTTFSSESEMHYEIETHRVELIKLNSTSEFDGEVKQDWCVRVFDYILNKYIDVQPLFAIRFVK